MSKLSNTIIQYPILVDGILTRVLEAGGGPCTVLFLHGVGARADRWRFNLQAVANAGFRAIAVDLPGHGFAYKGPTFEYGVPGYSRFIKSLLKVLQVSKAHLVGTSLGAHVLGTVLIQDPQLAHSLVLVGATGIFPIGAEARQNIVARITDTSREGVAKKLKSVVFDAGLVDERVVEEEWRINSSPGAMESFVALGHYFVRYLDEDVIGERLPEALSKRPRMVAWGESDRSVPVSVGEKTAALLECSLVRIPGTAHAPYWEASEIFNSHLLHFLDQAGNAA